jgi:hypothetical protein
MEKSISISQGRYNPRRCSGRDALCRGSIERDRKGSQGFGAGTKKKAAFCPSTELATFYGGGDGDENRFPSSADSSPVCLIRRFIPLLVPEFHTLSLGFSPIHDPG